jgi:hypothetical protein
MNFFVSLKSEFKKTRRTAIWYLCLICTLLTPFYAYVFNIEEDKVVQFKQDPWNRFFMGEAGMVLNVMILPFFLILICTLLAQLEYKNNTWKQVYASPQPLLHVFFAKFLKIQLILIGILIITNVIMLIVLYATHYFRYPLNMEGSSLRWQDFLIFNGRIYITVMSISALQFWLGLRFKNFIVPLVIGLFLWIFAMMLMETIPWVHDNKYPYLYPMRNYFPRLESDRTTVIWGSLAYTALFLGLGYWDFKRKMRSA